MNGRHERNQGVAQSNPRTHREVRHAGRAQRERQENHGRIKKEDQPPSKATDLQHRNNGEPGALPRPPSILSE